VIKSLLLLQNFVDLLNNDAIKHFQFVEQQNKPNASRFVEQQNKDDAF
jgi:hypothetical protein